MGKYKLTTNGILCDDGACIPVDENNRDYRKYLDWIKDGNVADPVVPEPINAPPTEIVFNVPVRAPDFLVNSPKPNSDPQAALSEAVSEGVKQKKSIAFIALSLAKYLDDVEKRLKKGKL